METSVGEGESSTAPVQMVGEDVEMSHDKEVVSQSDSSADESVSASESDERLGTYMYSC